MFTRGVFLTQYGVGKDCDIFMVGDSPIVIDTDGDITIKERVFEGSKGLWELLTRNEVNRVLITKDDLKTCKKILTMTNAHLSRYQAEGNYNSRKIISFCHFAPLCETLVTRCRIRIAT